MNTEDEIEVFSKEAFPFYNRVLLPDYITGTLQWDNLVKMTDAEEYAYQVKLHRGISITDINRNDKTVTDSNGSVHAYDILILATGSRSAMLRDVPDMKGIFSMRNRGDADTFLQHTRETSGRVVIIGGGLLGIELAAALREVQMEATVIQRTSRLMNRQLDPLGSQLLHEELTDKGIDIYYNDETDRFLGTGAVSGIRLKSGLTIDCTAVVMAIGTTPNIELARESGLECKRGVVVNDYLQTSDPSIFAIGEIAEFKGRYMELRQLPSSRQKLLPGT
ncbi:FAD-dependent oxidoreductase [Niabella sp. W65]|nr:FAD-dependent oxidoreductase [Niabella sp. W65]MCH7362457.1 FAD-dependent oxidoreductase [Niabella sp. W65]ULT46371.1 FAD-dependent oxidoreductase [Niabella sp. I65]